MRFSSFIFLSGAYAWARPSTLATLSSWRRFLLGDSGAYAWATPSTLATLSSWRHFLFGDAYFLGDAFLLATPIAASNGEKIKTKNQSKVFSQTCFSFIWVTSLKNPRKGKRVSLLKRLLHRCLHKSTKIKLQVGCIPTARDGTPLQGL